jgi:hypothetical protein
MDARRVYPTPLRAVNKTVNWLIQMLLIGRLGLSYGGRQR